MRMNHHLFDKCRWIDCKLLPEIFFNVYWSVVRRMSDQSKLALVDEIQVLVEKRPNDSIQAAGLFALRR